ncbi:hypothetical protein G6F68_020904 [Rhizopus microsporus]|nr:hypothetical protein G6F68_020904 [Rhizopus microsporus]
MQQTRASFAHTLQVLRSHGLLSRYLFHPSGHRLDPSRPTTRRHLADKRNALDQQHPTASQVWICPGRSIRPACLEWRGSHGTHPPDPP